MTAKIKSYPPEKLPATFMRFALHSQGEIDVPVFRQRIRTIKQCNHQGGGEVEVCYGEYFVRRPQKMVEVCERLSALVGKWHGQTTSGLRYDRGDVPVLVLEIEIPSIA